MTDTGLFKTLVVDVVDNCLVEFFAGKPGEIVRVRITDIQDETATGEEISIR